MKKILFLSLMGMTLAACSNEDLPFEDTTQPTSKVLSNIISAEEAAEIATEAFNAFTENGAKSRAAVSMKSQVLALGRLSSRAEGVDADTLLYVVNFDNKQGYAIVSAAVNDEYPVIGFVEEGEFDALESTQNPSFNYYLNAAQDHVASTLGGSTISGPTPAFTERYYLVDDRIAPKVEVEWGQDYPEGMFCPNKISGCVATAMAQIMTVVKAPASVQLTYDARDIETQVLNWDEICKHKHSELNFQTATINNHLAQCEANEETHKVIGRLCRELTKRIKATFKETSTSASSFDARSILADLLTNHEVSPYKYLFKNDSSYKNIFDELRNNIIYFRGENDILEGGHAWVADGGKITGSKIVRTYTQEHNIITGEPLVEVVYNTTTYFHFNWGWDGLNNGYFVAGVFDTTKGSNDDDSPVVIPKIRSRTNYGTEVCYYIVKI